MINCKGKSTPDTISFITAFMSGIYVPIGTIGNLLLALAILVDPLKMLRRRFHMWLVNVAVAATIISAIVNPYRVYANYLKGIGKSPDKVIGPMRPALSHMCHVNLFGSQILFLMIFAVRMLEQICYFQLRPKSSMIFFAVGTIMIWGVCYSVGGLTVIYGFDNVEWPIYSVTCIGALLGLILSTCLVYRPLLKARDDGEEMRPISGVPHTAQKSHKEDSVEAVADDAKADEIQSGDINIDNGSKSPTLSESGNLNLKLEDAKALVSSFRFLFYYSAPSFVMVYLTAFDAVESCTEYFWLKHVRILFVTALSALVPYVLIFTVPNMKRSVVAVLKMKRRSAVAPADETI